MSGAERQARFLKRLREKAEQQDGLGERAREAMDVGIATIWAIVQRPGTDGRMFAEAQDFADLPAYRTYWAERLRDGEDASRWFDTYRDDATDEERAALDRAIAVSDAARLAHVATSAKPKRKRT